MEARLYNSLRDKSLSDELGGGSIALPELVAGNDLLMRIRFAERVDGTWAQLKRRVASVQASIGFIDARPTGGTVKLKNGSSVTSALPYNVAASALDTALSGIYSGSMLEVISVDGSWLISSNIELDEPEPVQNMLSPRCKVRWWGDVMPDGSYLYQLRFVQAPLAFTDELRLTLPEGPKIAEVQAADLIDDFAIPAIQSLALDPWFQGTYKLKRGLRVTPNLSPADGAEVLQAACQYLLTASEIEDGAELTVEDVGQDLAHITFGGALAGIGQDLLEVIVVDAPEPDPTIRLSLRSAAMAAALRGGSITPQLEIRWRLYEETAADEDLERTMDVIGYRSQVTVIAPLNWDEMALWTDTEWARPLDATKYPPFSRDALFFGTRGYAYTAASTGSHSVTHGLGTDRVTWDAVDGDGGFLPRSAEGVLATIPSPGVIDFVIASGVATPVEISMAALGQEEHFQGHTHGFGDLPEVEAAFLAMAARVAALEDMAPVGGLQVAAASTSAEIARWKLPPVSSVIPSRSAIVLPAAGIGALDDSKLRGVVLPAIHTVETPGTLPLPLPPAPLQSQCGKVWRNNSGAAVIVPGMGWPSASVAANGLVGAAWDAVTGRGYWFPVALLSGTSSYYPLPFRLPLFELIVTEDQFRARTRFRLEVGFETAILKSANRGRWQFRTEYGVPVAAESPGTPGGNLQSITWDTSAPAINQTIYLGPVPTVHRFGLDVRRTVVGDANVFAGNATVYGATRVSTAPSGPNFAIRGFLDLFDTVDASAFPGLVAVRGLDVGAGDGDSQTGFAWITA